MAHLVDYTQGPLRPQLDQAPFGALGFRGVRGVRGVGVFEEIFGSNSSPFSGYTPGKLT